ncbi:Uncharacterized protein T11_12230 [Trichinella zimbabwensis]|uniref:Uncharacterized protein n=1 Tax=Trichinella zimbabwensis TaxID=268475 RepID=A0A0V1I256_9BILA|nr:Uncharacterized protein T11_12230 [Trichinella zimbabwensis]
MDTVFGLMPNVQEKIPKGWLAYSKHGDPLLGTPFICSKCPLKKSLCRKINCETDWFTPHDLKCCIQNLGLRLRLVIDLTATDRYYDPGEFLTNGIDVVKIPFNFYNSNNGKEGLPAANVMEKFYETVDNFIHRNRDPNSVICVHCTHGVNRTGYFICKYLIERKGWKPKKALEEFITTRGHEISKEAFVEDILKTTASSKSSMSLVMITGYPCSGKTMLARALKNALSEAEGNNKQVLHISDDDFPRFHRSIYEKPYEEGQLRSFLKSEVVKNLKADTIVIMDSLNYLKSFRYELYCAAKAAQVSYFLIRCGNNGWRSSFFNMIRPQEMRYKLTTVHDLVKRYELPEDRNKWDQIQYTFCLMEELVPECAKKLYPLILQGKKLTSNRSTEAQPLASAQFLSELDRLTSAINTAIQERLSENPIGEGDQEEEALLTVEGVDEPIKLKHVFTAQFLADVKRQFFAYVRMHPVEDMKVVANMYVHFINNTSPADYKLFHEGNLKKKMYFSNQIDHFSFFFQWKSVDTKLYYVLSMLVYFPFEEGHHHECADCVNGAIKKKQFSFFGTSQKLSRMMMNQRFVLYKPSKRMSIKKVIRGEVKEIYNKADQSPEAASSCLPAFQLQRLQKRAHHLPSIMLICFWFFYFFNFIHCQLPIPNPFLQHSLGIQSFSTSGFENLYPYGVGTKDERLYDKEEQTGRQIDLFSFFPYYGARYNYTMLSIHGYIAFGNLVEEGMDFSFGSDIENWPEKADPALIAVYTCRQRSSKLQRNFTGVFYRVVFRKSMMSLLADVSNPFLNNRNLPRYIDGDGDDFLDMIQEDLRKGMVGANSFHADMALVVTWQNVTFYQASSQDEDAGKASKATYQAVLATDRAGQLSYAILNYHTLGYAGSDINGASRRGRCKACAEFNGGNKTGSVLVDPVYSKMPMQLAMMSSVPHQARGRYLFRVDDIVRKGGCSNLTVGTYRLTIYPDIVNSMGDSTVLVNGPCMTSSDSPILYVAENKPAHCTVKNAAIAECKMVRYFQWGVKYVYFSVRNIKTYIGSIYYVPSGLDPYALDLGQIHLWYMKDPPLQRRIRWYASNFTDNQLQRIASLQLSVWGYKERRDDREMKFIPTLNRLSEFITVSNTLDPRDEIGSYTLTKSTMKWLQSIRYELLTYRFGFLKLSVRDDTQPYSEGTSIWSHPIPLIWFYDDEVNLEAIASQSCLEWFAEDGQQWNFIRDTETNSSCPCRYEQALIDIGRFMPHPRCSQRFRNLNCDVYIGAKECFLSTNNVEGSYVTHYGQVCCYDRDGYLMHTSYQTVVQVPDYPYNPGFPQRAYEFGTYPFTKQFELPTLSHYYHDILPYFSCCKWSVEHCQFFYWRRPSSSCLEYQAPGIASIMGAGHVVTFDRFNYTFNQPGIYMFLHKPKQHASHHHWAVSPEVQIQIRLERYPDRSVDFGHRDTYQGRLVKPLDVAVVTGVAVQEGNAMESDRVLILLRKDTRRYKYRTHILVNDELRYFDTIKTQRFRGVTVYVNDWKEGQSEVYVVLEHSRIGVRIRESYAMEITRQLAFEESMGLLDVFLSIPPEFRLVQDPLDNKAKFSDAVAGLAGTFSGTDKDDFLRPDRRTYQAPGDDEIAYEFANSWKVNNEQFADLFTLVTSDHRDWPEAELIGPVFPASQYYDNEAHSPQFTLEFNRRFESCDSPYFFKPDCPSFEAMQNIKASCLQMYQCNYDSFELKQMIIGLQTKQEYVHQLELHNSCGAVNVEYPDYLIINPATGKLYLEGDQVQFECYPTHWLKGTGEYTCKDGRWNQGWQPWCRSKQLETTLKILTIIFGILLIIAVIGAIFFCCWLVKVGDRKRVRNVYRSGEPLSTKKLPSERTIVFPPGPPGHPMDYAPSTEVNNLRPVNNAQHRQQGMNFFPATGDGSTPSSRNSATPTIGLKTLV